MSPLLEIPSCCVLPPVPTCRGVRPSQAANCRPDLKVDRSVAVATNAVAVKGPMPGIACTAIVRQVKYLNNIVEQDHRAVKRVTKPMLNFKSFQAAKSVLAGIELIHMIRKGQLLLEGGIELSFTDQFYALAGKIRPV